MKAMEATLDEKVAAAGAREHSDDEDASDEPDDDAEDHEDAKIAGDFLQSLNSDNIEHQEHVTKDTTPLVGAAEHTEIAENATDQDKSEAQIFHVTISLRDDWLHRGDALQDMDLQTYAEYIERAAKPIRGADLQKMVKSQVFAFDAHYKLANGFMQVVKPGHRRCIARFVLPNCVREDVNEGEENAQFKAFHCSLLRCPGAGMCADPLMCASMLFPNSSGVYKFRPAWRAREKEILVLAMRATKRR